MPELDFSGLNSAAQSAFKPHFAEVLHRARRRRRTRMVGAVLTAVAVLAGGGVAVAGIGGDGGLPEPATPATTDPQRTPDFLPTPNPSASAQAQAPASGLRFGPMQAGDLDRLYVRYNDCHDGDCQVGVASSSDRGRNWQRTPLPVPENSLVSLHAVGPRTAVARVHTRTRVPGAGNRFIPGESFWLVSLDEGRTWQRTTTRPGSALPAGARVPELLPGPEIEPLIAVDEATAEIISLSPAPTLRMSRFVDSVPPAAGLWISGYTDSESGSVGRVAPAGSAVAVSRDGGRSWQRYVFPEEVVAGGDFGAAAIASHDGRTVYAVGRLDGALTIYRSDDGGRSWRRTAGTAPVGSRAVSAAVRADGTLVIQAGQSASEDPVMFDSADRGVTVRPVPLGPGAAAVPVPGGYAQSGWPSSSGTWLSADGVTWSYVGPPS